MERCKGCQLRREEEMIVNDLEAVKRLSSPMNLMNLLRKETKSDKSKSMDIFGLNRPASPDKHSVEGDRDSHTISKEITFNPFQSPQVSLQNNPSSEPVLDNILNNNESQIKLGLAHDRALELLNKSTELLLEKLDDIKADKLPSVISAASKTVEGIRKERNEQAKLGKDRDVHFHFYTPEQKKVSDYEVIDVA